MAPTASSSEQSHSDVRNDKVRNDEVRNDNVDQAVAEGGAYEVIRKRLTEQGAALTSLVESLNQARMAEFGGSDMSVLGRVRVRTENNCIARDIVQVGETLLFGYNVYIGLKKETKIDDVFALFSLTEKDGHYDIEPVAASGTFLSEPGFVNDFDELYRYYKNTQLIQLTVKDGKLLAAFQIGDRLDDLRVFRWAISPDGKTLQYIDNRGERDIQLPPAHDFEWIVTTREDSVHGKHPHINILDTVFVETINGDLTIKIENNTEDGLGIYREPVEDKTQSLDDAQIEYARLGGLILIKIRPYREETWRYFIFNTMTETVHRIDAIGQSCVQLPEDHGVVFPGGYYLQDGETKSFAEDVPGLRFKRVIKSPNGEDVLFVFYEPVAGVVALFAYNLIAKSLQNPIYGHGYALAENGQIVIFSAEEEPTRVHPMQIWQTPYESAEYASQAPASQTFYGRIGNAELVRGISDIFSVIRFVNNQQASSKLYEELTQSARKLSDDYYWLAEDEMSGIQQAINEVIETSELVIDEFEKVKSIRHHSAKAMADAEQQQTQLEQSIQPENWHSAEEYVQALGNIRRQRGHLITLKELRYIDVDRIGELDESLQALDQELSESTVEFLSSETALDPYQDKIKQLNSDIEAATTVSLLEPVTEVIEATTQGLDLLSELMGTLKVKDATVRTAIIDAVSQVYAQLNQCKASAKHKQKSLGSEEAIAQFSAQFKLFSQSIANALSQATTPDKCDEQLSRLLVQLEELESQFSEFDQFLSDIMDKREEVYESFESHKQQLVDEQQRRAQSLSDAADRILKSIDKRVLKFTEADQLNTFFASDPLTMKVRELTEQLRELDSAVKADDIEARYKAIKEQGLRSLRDKTDIFEDGGKIIKLGPRHKFSVNTQELDLTLLPRDGKLNIHLTGTDFFEPIENDELIAQKAYWDMSIVSETPDVYRAEFLAYSILEAAERGESDLSIKVLHEAALEEEALQKLVQTYANPRYKEGYQKGIHDFDATQLLKQLLPTLESADLLKFNPTARALARIFWANVAHQVKPRARVHHSEGELATEQAALSFDTWPERARSASHMQQHFSSVNARQLLSQEVATAITAFVEQHGMPFVALDIEQAADYLVAELSTEKLEFIQSAKAQTLSDELRHSMDDNTWRQFQAALEKMKGWPGERWKLTHAWFVALVESKQLTQLERYIPEATALINAESRLSYRTTQVDTELVVNGLMGEHVRIQNRTLQFSLDEFLQRLSHHQSVVIPTYHRYLELRQEVIHSERENLRLEEFKPRPLSSFVRNRLINESYLPIIGDNLAKQMGTVGEDKRTDLMGLLMMISPPGYGKTTLMEYVASRLGLIFMKINCPSIGHDVISLDPEQANNATARQELIKLNLALEMGNNVMLYLDDIQHTNPEFLQKFISLCDGTRRVDGIWKGKSKTYDMRGRKFCVVMAGNPYTETGEAFKIPDMLANRADIYNLGDILGGMEEQFALSYIENALTSNPVLAPLALRDMNDVYRLVEMAQGKNVPTTDLKHQYSGAEIKEIIDVLKKLFRIRDVVLKINQQYIASAAMNDKYRTEPSFKLQGSYRNMNKMTEKVTAVMNEDELLQMIADHYLGESQLLTTGAEDNLLKLAELRGNITDDQQARWNAIKADFLRNKAMGGDGADGATRVTAQLNDIVGAVSNITEALQAQAELSKNQHTDRLKLELKLQERQEKLQARQEQSDQERIQQRTQQQEAKLTSQETDANHTTTQVLTALTKIAHSLEKSKPEINVVNQPVPGLDKILTVLADTIENSIFPLVRSMDKKLEIDLGTHDRMKDISQQLRQLKVLGADVTTKNTQ
ncbi:DNA repair ATPase [Marinibactrum halimedae]|uniref:AAA family ATPase n=1 Tax=Marinibactrum halimedae TaxID=1444977 RepID=A0AA37TDM1_9GAMM|nr:DNA repair ATPase [Marinibactrum halimedae]MCD9460532.1 DNA repair ATPase [Marinibactrum halimedae]GLS27895.1 hypothetical protein GCM10007877_36140 [Marinibactrum halimedae]